MFYQVALQLWSKADTHGIISLLHQISEFVKSKIESDCDTEIFCDAGGRPWTIPPDILITSDRPDLVILSRKNKSISIFELTVPFENNIKPDHQYKCHKYAQLVIDLSRKCNYQVRFYAVEIGCRGLISLENSNRLHAFLKSTSIKFKPKDFRIFKQSLCKTSVLASFIIYKARFQPTWCSTPFISNI